MRFHLEPDAGEWVELDDEFIGLGPARARESQAEAGRPLEDQAEFGLSGRHELAGAENFAWIAAATNQVGPDGISLWDEEDGFFYDVLRRPDGSSTPLKVRSIVGLMPLAAATVVPASIRTEFPELVDSTVEFFDRHPAVRAALWGHGRQAAETGPALFALFDESRIRRVLARMLDENEFPGPHGIRSVSRYHGEHPYVIKVDGQVYQVGYRPAESDTGMFGGNSNWRGPVWMPINVMLIRALLNLHMFYGDEFRVECPTGSGRQCTLFELLMRSRNGSSARSCGMRTATVRYTVVSRSCRTTRTGVTSSCSTSICTVTTARVSVPATRPAGPERWGCCHCCSAVSTPASWWHCERTPAL